MLRKHTAIIAQLRPLLEKHDSLHGDLNASGLRLESDDGNSFFVVESPLDPNYTWVVNGYMGGQYADESEDNDVNVHYRLGLYSPFWSGPLNKIEEFGVSIHARGFVGSGADWDEAAANMELILLDRKD